MASTVNSSLSAVRSFFRFALSRKLVDRDPSYVVKGPKKQKPLPQFVREEEMNRLLDTPQMWEEGFTGLRARTIIILFYETGIRLAELIGLDVEDVDFAAHQIKVTGKRNKQRIIPFGAELEEALREYIAQRDSQPQIDAALILSDKGKRMTRQADDSQSGGENREAASLADDNAQEAYASRASPLFCHRDAEQWRRTGGCATAAGT